MDVLYNFKNINEEHEKLALQSNFDINSWYNFKSTQKTIQQSQPQTLVTKSLTHYYTHSDSGTYHVNSHSNYSQYSQSHGNYLQHSDGMARGTYAQTHPNTYHADYPDRGRYADIYYPDNGGYVQYAHYDTEPHTDGPIGGVQYTQNYSQYSQHSDAGYYHTDYGLSHQNYIPSQPVVFDGKQQVSVDEIFSGSISLGIYSYDKNIDNPNPTTDNSYFIGSYGNRVAYDSASIYFDVSIRKVKNLDGSASQSNWVTLASNVKESSIGNGITIDLNTIDPLKTGNSDPKATEGYYQIQVVARNPAINYNGVSQTYDSSAYTVEIIIAQTTAQFTVTNTSEFINFIFGQTGAYVQTQNTFKPYPYYVEPYATYQNEQNGIFVVISLTNASTTKYQKGYIKLIDTSNNNVLSTANIWWSNSPSSAGSIAGKSGGTPITGYAYIDRSSFAAINWKDCVIEVVVQDYLDSALTKPVGTPIVSRYATSSGTGAMLQLSIDTSAPVISSATQNTASNKYLNKDTITITATDISGIGVQRITYQYKDPITGQWSAVNTMATSNTLRQPSLTGSTVIQLPKGEYGVVQVNVQAIDFNNQVSGTKIMYLYIDNADPQFTITPKSTMVNGWYNDQVVVNLSVSDVGPSGVDTWRYAISQSPTPPTSGWITGSGTSQDITINILGSNYVFGYVKDKAGNEYTTQLGPLKVNSSVKITDIGVSDTGNYINIAPQLQINGKNAYVVKGDAFSGDYYVAISDRDLSDTENVRWKITNINTGVVRQDTAKKLNLTNSGGVGTLRDTNKVWYVDSGTFNNWEDGVYKIEIIVSDNKSDGASNISTASDYFYIIVKKTAPPAPIITATDDNSGNFKNVSIQYPLEDAFNIPELKALYKNEYKVGLGNYANYTGAFPVTGDTTIVARTTDFALNTSTSALNVTITKTPPPSMASPTTPTGGTQDVVVDETRSSVSYFINIRKNTDGSLNTSVFQFLK